MSPGVAKPQSWMSYEIWHAQPDGSVSIDVVTKTFDSLPDVLNETFARHGPMIAGTPQQMAAAANALLERYKGQIRSISMHDDDNEFSQALLQGGGSQWRIQAHSHHAHLIWTAE